jgi:hypothetical protein
MKVYGFVYIWHDRKRKKFCVGSHYGSPTDKYISSTGHLKSAFKKRPEDFRRKILWKLEIPDLKLLQRHEQYWLDMIKIEELGVKYYNYKKHASGGNGPRTRESIDKAIATFKQNGYVHSNETRCKISKALIGKSHTSEVIERIANLRKANGNYKHTEEQKAHLSACMSGDKHPLYGKHRSPETKAKLSESHKGQPGFWKGKERSQETKDKISATLKRKFLEKELSL